MSTSTVETGRDKTHRALAAMNQLGITRAQAKPVLRALVRVYDDWSHIEAENYRVLIDAIYDPDFKVDVAEANGSSPRPDSGKGKAVKREDPQTRPDLEMEDCGLFVQGGRELRSQKKLRRSTVASDAVVLPIHRRAMSTSTVETGRDKTHRALAAMNQLGITRAQAKPVLRAPVRVYDDWSHIEAENYRVLIDAIYDPDFKVDVAEANESSPRPDSGKGKAVKREDPQTRPDLEMEDCGLFVRDGRELRSQKKLRVDAGTDELLVWLDLQVQELLM